MSGNEAKLGGGTPVPVRRYVFREHYRSDYLTPVGNEVVRDDCVEYDTELVRASDYDLLFKERDELRDQLQASQCAEAMLSDEVRGLKEQRDSLRADAERYRWLRDSSNTECDVCVYVPANELEEAGLRWPVNDELDAAIDSAMKEQK
jgi:hypothetical protein